MKLKKYLKTKLHGARVTEANINYTGSITIDRDLMDAADLKVFEIVQVVNVTNGERFETYVIEGARGSGYIGLNGGAARKGKIGDKLIIFSVVWIKGNKKFKVKVVIVDENNKVQEIKISKITT
jgi:aspartate 1-decarboxylase